MIVMCTTCNALNPAPEMDFLDFCNLPTPITCFTCAGDLRDIGTRVKRFDFKQSLHGYHEGWRDRELPIKKPFLTARDIIFLREMKVSL